jgi:type I restriction enzyme S subunit
MQLLDDHNLAGRPAPPKEWEIAPAKRLMSSKNGGGAVKNTLHPEFSPDLYPAFSASGQDVWSEQFAFDQPGLVLSAVGARCGKTFKASGKWNIAANTHCLFPKNDADLNFLWYLTNNELWWLRAGSAQPFVQVKATLDRQIPIPPLPTQIAIANFLDRETAKIDELIANLESLIALLKEKRQTVISYAVTKGLNPNAKMKDSGIDWIGEIPEHWEVRKLTSLLKLKGGGTPSKEVVEFWSGSIPWVSPKDAKCERITDTHDHISPEAIANSSTSLISRGSVLIVVRSGILKHTLPAMICDADVTLNQDMKAFTDLAPAINNDFLLRWIQGNNRSLLSVWSKVGATVESIDSARLNKQLIPLPPPEEQLEIVKQLDLAANHIDESVSHSVALTALLKEKRSTLISAAVTGQIEISEAPGEAG